MDSTDVLSLLESLDDGIDDLEESLSYIIKNQLSDISPKLPLLDKAKLYVLLTYAIESILFSYLRLNGVNAQQHPVFVELTRVKQYFAKIKVAEAPITEKRDLVLDVGAAKRFIAAGLAGNEKYDLRRAEQQAKEKARSHIKFEETTKKRKIESLEETPGKVAVARNDSVDSSDSESESSPIATTPVKRLRTLKSAPETPKETSNSESTDITSKKKDKKTRKKKKKKKDGKRKGLVT